MHTLIQISDTHLLADPRAHLNGRCPQISLDVVLAAVQRQTPPDLVVASGDLVHDESDSGYHRLDNSLAALSSCVLALPGNHDDPATMARAMRRSRVLQPAIVDGWQIVPLNSHVPGHVGGRLVAAEISKLDEQLTDHSEFAVIAVHHPPLALGSAWLDTIGLDNGEELLRLLDRHAQVRALLFGHAHQSFDRRRGHYRLLGTPSTWRQFLPRSACFAEDRRAPGYRVVRLSSNGSLSSQVHRVAYPPHHETTSG